MSLLACIATSVSVAASVTMTAPVPSAAVPQIIETRTVSVTQTVTLQDIPADAGQVRLWVPIPGDSSWQRVLDCEVVSAPGRWRVVPQAEGRGAFVHVELDHPATDTASVVVRCIVQRHGVHLDLDDASAPGEIQAELFAADLDPAAPLMQVDARVRALADEACGDESDVARQAMALLRAVADKVDHYSINDAVPTCGRGAAGDCLDHGGGCCTDLHSLFIAMARSRGIPARMQYGYRLLDGREGREYDPGYRCWVEFFVPGTGWVATDIVAADAATELPHRWVSLSSTRVQLWAGRSFELTPPARHGPIDTMICGWAEIDGRAVDPLPAHDGAPSKLRRTVSYQVLDNTRGERTARLPQ